MTATFRSRILPALALALLGSPAHAGQPAAGQAAGETQRYSPEALRADLREMYQRLEAAHYDLYARRSKAEYDAYLEKTLLSLDRPLTLFEAEVAFQKFAAYGRIAHARVDFPSAEYAAFREKGGKVLPLRIRVVAEPGGEAVYVTENLSGLGSIALGDRLLQLDGAPIAAWLEKLEANISGDNAYLVHTQLENRFATLLWLELGERASFRLQLRRASGQPFEAVVPARSRAEMLAAEKLLPKPAELDWDAREAKMLDGGVAYLRPGPFYENTPGAANPWDPAAFHAFIDKSFAAFLAAGAKSLLIDLRQNPGGDDSFSNRMIAFFADESFRFASDFQIRVSAETTASNRRRIELGDGDPASVSSRMAAAFAGKKNGELVHFEIPPTPPRAGERFAGKVYLLIDRHSYSNTANVAALCQDYGFATILGEETADLATTFGAMEQFQLSRTGITVGYPKALILRPNGQREPRGVVPDVAIPSPVVPPVGDPMLEKAIAIVRSGR